VTRSFTDTNVNTLTDPAGAAPAGLSLTTAPTAE
jgi:hypothetical protein